MKTGAPSTRADVFKSFSRWWTSTPAITELSRSTRALGLFELVLMSIAPTIFGNVSILLVSRPPGSQVITLGFFTRIRYSNCSGRILARTVWNSGITSSGNAVCRIPLSSCEVSKASTQMMHPFFAFMWKMEKLLW